MIRRVSRPPSSLTPPPQVQAPPSVVRAQGQANRPAATELTPELVEAIADALGAPWPDACERVLMDERQIQFIYR